MTVPAQNQPVRRDAGPRFGPAAVMAGPPVQKSLNFKASAKRLIDMLRPERASVFVALGLGIASVTLMVIGPRILGHATDLIFSGVIGGKLPAGMSKEAAVAAARA